MTGKSKPTTPLTTPIKRLTPQELIKFVREKSPFYKKLYSALPDGATLTDLPVLSLEEFWKSNGLKDNTVLTGPMRDGVVFKSGGTTGNPKFSVFSKDEWKDFTESFGRGIVAGGLDAGDRVVNLFYVGQLYGSFLFINKSIEEAPLGVLQLPVAGSTSFEETLSTIEEFQANALAGVPSTIMNLAEYIAEKAPGRLPVKKIFFGGEPVYGDQRERLLQIFPGVQILSIGYASTDAGLLGYADRGCKPGEHRIFDQETVVEVLDEQTYQPIEKEGLEGLLVVTNLSRTLMPIVRYPAGDRGMWLEPTGTPNRKFMLMGRSEEAARIGLIKLYVQDVRDVLQGFRAEHGVLDFQLVVYHRELLDGLIVRIAVQADPTEPTESKKLKAVAFNIIAEIHKARPLYEEFVRERKVHPIEIQWIKMNELETNSRTGKLRRVIDRRLNS
jgi:phenylacetate-CoA ligase